MREGRASELYDLDAIRQLEHDTAAAAGLSVGGVGPWWNPPLYAWAFAPLAASPFPTALLLWTALNLTAAVAAAYLLARIAAPARATDRLLVALLVLCSAPLVQSLAHGQNSAISLLLVAMTVTTWRSDQRFTAGVCVGLLAYKPQLAALLAVVLVLHRGRRAAAGILAVGLTFLLLTVLLMPGALTDYLLRLPQNLRTMQVEQVYLWDRHVTLTAFWRLLLLGRDPGETSWLVNTLALLCAVPLFTGLPLAAWRSGGLGKAPPCPWPPRGDADGVAMPPRTDAIVAATLACGPLLMPFYFDYDLLLLAGAAVLVTGVTRHSLLLWSALYAWLFLNPYLAGVARLNLTVPLLFTLALSLVDRALHGRPRAGWVEAAAEPAVARDLARAA